MPVYAFTWPSGELTLKTGEWVKRQRGSLPVAFVPSYPTPDNRFYPLHRKWWCPGKKRESQWQIGRREESRPVFRFPPTALRILFSFTRRDDLRCFYRSLSKGDRRFPNHIISFVCEDRSHVYEYTQRSIVFSNLGCWQ